MCFVRLERTMEQLNADLTLDAVTVQWCGNYVTLWKDGRQLTILEVTDDIQAKITRWCDKNHYRCPQVHDGKIWV